MSRVLALDPGERRIGLALSDEGRRLASPLATLVRGSTQAAVSAVLDVAEREEAGEIVVGLPISLSGDVGPQARRALRFADALRASARVPVRTWNEQFTSAEARERLIEAGARRGKRRRPIDAMAAAVLLQSYLDAQP